MSALLELCDSFLLLAFEAREDVMVNSHVYGEGFREGKYTAYIDAHKKLSKALNQDIPEPENDSIEAITIFAKTVGIDITESPFYIDITGDLYLDPTESANINRERYTTYEMHKRGKFINGYVTLSYIKNYLMENYAYLRYEHKVLNSNSNPNSKN